MQLGRRGGGRSTSHDHPSVVEHRPPSVGRGPSHSSLSWCGVPPIHQACQQWHPFPLCARRLGTSGPDCIPDTHREQHTDTLMDLFIRPFITQGANGESQWTATARHRYAVALSAYYCHGRAFRGQNNLVDEVSSDPRIIWKVEARE